MTTETILRSAGIVSHYFGADQPFLVAFWTDAPLVWTEIVAPHEEVAALRFWEAHPGDQPTNSILVYDPSHERHRPGFAMELLIERNGEPAYITDIELDDTLPPPATTSPAGAG